MKDIEILNRRLGDALGRCGMYPRFAWMLASEIFYYFREHAHERMERFCWADRIGPVWVLAQWRRPAWIDQNGGTHETTREQWWSSFNGQFPYPERGAYYAHPETALPPGVKPTAEMTAGYIHSLDRQMAANYAEHKRRIDGEIAADAERLDTEWVETVQNSNPAFSNFEPGKRGGHVSFGGM